MTGTSIRGVTPVGANSVTVDQQDIQKEGGQTLDEVLKQVPALSDMGQVGQGQHNSTYFSPNIHQLGGSASGSTLVIMDGLRFPLGGTSHSQTDPSIIPTIAIQRVEVLADGSSSIYGSDAVAGVVNFITRNNYDGLLLQAEEGAPTIIPNTTSAPLVAEAGKGEARLSLSSIPILATFRWQRALALRTSFSFGGTNQRSLNCSPATLSSPLDRSLI